MTLRERMRSWLFAESTPAARAELQSYVGATGTRFTLNRIVNAEFNNRLTGWQAAATWEQMRREAMVRATLNMVNLPILAAEWRVEAEDTAVQEFLQELLFKRLDFQKLLHHMLLVYPFGYEVMEKVWALDGGKWWLSDLEHRGQATIYGWQTDPDTGKFAGIEQHVWKGTQYQTVYIPAKVSPMDARMKLVHMAWDMDGNNFEGISGLRSAYPYWWAKMEVFKIAAAAIERFAMGIPMAEPPVDPVTGQARFTPDDQASAIDMLKAMRAGSQAYVWNPGGWRFSIMGADGQLRYDPMPFLQYCDEMIALNALAEAINLGRTQSGSRAVGESQMDVFMLSLEAMADLIRTTLDEQVVKPALELNFPNADKIEACVKWADLSPTSPDQVAGFLSKIGMDGYITPDEDLEAHLRDLVDLPAKPGEISQAARAPRARGDQQLDEPRTQRHVHVHRALAQQAAPGAAYWREPTPLEQCMALGEIAGRQDDAREHIAQVYQQVRRSWVTSLQEQLRAAAADGDYSDIDQVEVPRELIAPAQKVIAEMCRDLYRFGQQTVRDELRRQEQLQKVSGSTPDAPVAPAMRDEPPDSAELRALFATRAAKYLRRLSRAVEEYAIEQALGALRTRGADGLDEGTLARIAYDILGGLFESTARLEAQVLAGEALNLGRDAGAQAASDQVEAAIYSAILDQNCCTECEQLDGEEYELDTPEYYADAPPNRMCESTASGTNYCRCLFVYRMAGEQQSRG